MWVLTDMGVTRLLDLSRQESYCQPGKAPRHPSCLLDCGSKFDTCGEVRTTGLFHSSDEDVVIKGRTVPDSPGLILLSLSVFFFLTLLAILVSLSIFMCSFKSQSLPRSPIHPDYFFTIGPHVLSRESQPSMVLQIQFLKECWCCRFYLQYLTASPSVFCEIWLFLT